jgi:hypothetical protein
MRYRRKGVRISFVWWVVIALIGMAAASLLLDVAPVIDPVLLTVPP